VRRHTLAAICSLGVLALAAGGTFGGALFVDQKSPQADDKNPGSEDRPFKAIQAAADAAQPGDTIWVKAGSYEEMTRIRRCGTPNQPITLSAWKDDRVQIGCRPRPLAAVGDWQPIEGSKSYQVRLANDVPEDFLVLLDGKPTITFMQDGPPKDETPNRATFRKSDRMLMFNANGKDPSALGKWEYGRRPSTLTLLSMEPPAAWWVIRNIEFSWQGMGMYLCGDHCVVEDCFFTHCYRGGIFLHGRMDTIRRCNFHRCGSGIHASGPGTAHILEDNLIVECGLAPEDDILIVDIPTAVPEGYGPTCFKGNNLCMVFSSNIVSDNLGGAGWYADCANVQSCRLIGNAFWDNPGGGIYNEALVNDTITQGNCFYRNGVSSSVATRWNIIENLFYGGSVGWYNLDLFPQRDGYMLLRRNAFVNPGNAYLSHYGTAWGQTAYPEVFRQCMVDYNRVWIGGDATLINDGGTGTKYKTLDEVRKEFGWELHGEVAPYDQETPEQAAAAMGGSVVTFRIPWGKHAAEARPMLANADLQGHWPAAPISVDGGAAPTFFWRVADGAYDANPLWGGYGDFVYHEFWQPYCCIGSLGENNGCRWYVGVEPKFPDNIMERMPSHRNDLYQWGWTVAYANGNRWLALEGLKPDKMLPQGVGYWSPYLGAAPGARITVSLKMRGKGLVSSEKGSPVVWLQFTNETGQNRSRVFIVGADLSSPTDAERAVQHPELTKGDYDWTEVKETITAPEGAVRMALFLGLLPCQGGVDFDDINLRTADGEAPAATQDILNPRLPLARIKETFCVDLAKAANYGLADEVEHDGKGGWDDQGPSADMHEVKTGERRFGGVPFAVLPGPKNAVILNFPGANEPDSISIPVGRKADTLFFLHAGTWCDPALPEFFRYVIRYADGKEVPLRVGPFNLKDWTAEPTARFPLEEETFSTTVETVPVLKYGRGSLYRMEWSAPMDRRQVVIERIDFAASGGKPVAVLLGMTGVMEW